MMECFNRRKALLGIGGSVYGESSLRWVYRNRFWNNGFVVLDLEGTIAILSSAVVLFKGGFSPLICMEI
jgi:hypothetical protein